MTTTKEHKASRIADKGVQPRASTRRPRASRRSPEANQAHVGDYVAYAPRDAPPLRFHWRADSPIGTLYLVSDGDHLRGIILCGDSSALPNQTARRHGAGDFDTRSDRAPFRAALRELDEYFAGRRRTFECPIAIAGTPFQHAVWSALRAIPFGSTTSYAAVAATVGAPTAVRAVGAANGRNPIPLVVPCHRVVGSNGGLTGYSAGVDRKRWLLQLESNQSAQSTAPAEATRSARSAVRPSRGTRDQSRASTARPDTDRICSTRSTISQDGDMARASVRPEGATKRSNWCEASRRVGGRRARGGAH
ncbi:MAG: methylated-DNA--[protein]-cysteine S-methyltransferase [Phycisphaerales bacterium]